MGYSNGDLKELQWHLYDILSKMIEVCNKLDIKYFIIGGTAIGAHFDQAILPWDDDIDIGMEREDYDRFLREAPALMAEGYVIQSPETEPNSPYYFTKLRKDKTLFVTEEEMGNAIHHGIFIDIFPFDRVPDSRFVEVVQYQTIRILHNIFVASKIELKGGDHAKFFYEAAAFVLPRKLIYRMLRTVQTLFNHRDTRYLNLVRMKRDHIERSTVNPPQRVKFGDLEVLAPNDMLTYLNHHYPGVRRDIPEDQQVNHSPLVLSFSSNPLPID